MNNLVKTERAVTAQEVFPLEREIASWELESSIQKTAALVGDYKNRAQLMAKELFIAHEALARMGGDRKSENAPAYTWSGYCEAVGISRKMAALYMSLYDPVQDRVRDPEEIKIEKMQLKSVNSYSESRVVHAMETGIRSEDWNVYDEREYKTRLSNQRCATLAQKWIKEKIKTNYKNTRDYFGEVMNNAKQYAKISLKTREQAFAQAEVFEHVTDFLSMIEDPEVRLAAAFNTGLRIRQIINELAASEAELFQYDISDELEG